MTEQGRNHRIVQPPSFHPCGNGRQIVVTEHRITIPVDWGTTIEPSPSSQSLSNIDIAFAIVEEVNDIKTQDYFMYELTSVQKESPNKAAHNYVHDFAKLSNADSLMLYLQGGPGFGASTPVCGIGFTQGGSWASQALTCKEYNRIVLMDQRGTGRSTPITKQWLEIHFPNLFLLDGTKTTIDDNIVTAAKQDKNYNAVEKAVSDVTTYLSNFRADSIVRDAEEIREALLLPLEPVTDGKPRPWGCALGQSFGGFCMMTYLSLIENPPKICLFTGGIAPMLTPAYDVYCKLWDRVKERSLRYYEVYPGDIKMVKKIVWKLIKDEQNNKPTFLPSGGKLTARRFLQSGLGLGGSPTRFASFHSMISSALLQTKEDIACDDIDNLIFTRAFLKEMDADQAFDEHPFYYWLHESIYADGPKNSPTNWAAHRAYLTKVKESSEFDYEKTSQTLDDDTTRVLFFGEMVFPWMASGGDYAELSGFGLTQLVNELHSKTNWKPLYNATHMKQVLGSTTTTSGEKKGKASVPPKSRAAAAMYFDDLYVDFDCCQKVTSRDGPLEKVKVYVTNEYQHSGIRDDGATIFTKLHGMATGCINTPS